jgi:hypothetical protein
VNTKAGRKEAMVHPEYIHTVVFSMTCPQWQTRKIVCELLVFLAYSDGYEHVIQGFELLQKFKKSLGLFDTWISLLLHTLDESHLLEYIVRLNIYQLKT